MPLSLRPIYRTAGRIFVASFFAPGLRRTKIWLIPGTSAPLFSQLSQVTSWSIQTHFGCLVLPGYVVIRTFIGAQNSCVFSRQLSCSCSTVLRNLFIKHSHFKIAIPLETIKCRAIFPIIELLIHNQTSDVEGKYCLDRKIGSPSRLGKPVASSNQSCVFMSGPTASRRKPSYTAASRSGISRGKKREKTLCILGDYTYTAAINRGQKHLEAFSS